jgi:hypothetical protein
MATETVPPRADGLPALRDAADALLDALKIIGAMSSVVAKLQEEVQALRGEAPGLADALDVCLDRLHDIVAPAQESAFNAVLSGEKGAAA